MQLPVFAAVLGAALLAPHVRADVAATTVVALDIVETMQRAEQVSPAMGPRKAAAIATREVEEAARSAIQLPPRLDIGVGTRFRSGTHEVAPETTLALSQEFSLGRFGAARARFAAALSREAQASLDVARRDVATQAGFAWIEARLAREQVRINEESLVHARAIVQIAASRVRVGSGSASEEALARALLGNAEAELIAARGRLFVAQAELRFAVGLPPSTPIEIVGELRGPDLRVDSAALTRISANQPDLRAARASADRSASSANALLASGKPFIALGPSVTREGTGDWIALARISVPLPLVNPAEVDAARQRADASVAVAQIRYVAAATARDLALALEEREHARELRDALFNSVLDPLREALRQALAQYEAGKRDVAEVLTARRELLAAEERWAQATADVRRADVRLARCLGLEPAALGGKAP